MMPRPRSWVTGLAAAGSSLGPTQTFITPSLGARKLMYLPSGLSRTVVRSGLPNSTCRGMSGTGSPSAAMLCGTANTKRSTSTLKPRPRREATPGRDADRRTRRVSMGNTSFLEGLFSGGPPPSRAPFAASGGLREDTFQPAAPDPPLRSPRGAGDPRKPGAVQLPGGGRPGAGPRPAPGPPAGKPRPPARLVPAWTAVKPTPAGAASQRAESGAAARKYPTIIQRPATARPKGKPILGGHGRST